MGHRVPQQVRMQLDPGDRAVFVAECSDAPVDNLFMMLVPSAVTLDPAMVSRLLNGYRLPSQQVRVLADEHYDMPAELRDDD
jgi:hypothetical protein